MCNYRMRIKKPESTFEAYNFWLADDKDKLQTSLESYMIHLSNDVCSVSVTWSDQKLLTNLCIGLASINCSFDNFENTNMVITWYDTVTDKLQALLESCSTEDFKYVHIFPVTLPTQKLLRF